MDQNIKEFDNEKYNYTINKIFNNYSTNQIVKMSKDYCKLND